MTIAAGFHFDSEVLLCTDTKHTYSDATKLKSSKIFHNDRYTCGITLQMKTIRQTLKDEGKPYDDIAQMLKRRG